MAFNIRPAVELSDTTDYWRRLTNELRLAILNSFFVDENLVNSEKEIRFLKFAEVITTPISLAPGTYITTKQTIEAGGSLEIQDGARVLSLDKPTQQSGLFRGEYLATAGQSYTFDIPAYATGHFYVAARQTSDTTVVTSKKYFFVSNLDTASVGTPETISIGTNTITSVTITGLVATVIPAVDALIVGSSSFMNVTTEQGYTPPNNVILPEDFVQ